MEQTEGRVEVGNDVNGLKDDLRRQEHEQQEALALRPHPVANVTKLFMAVTYDFFIIS
jgi:hypothetical protein